MTRDVYVIHGQKLKDKHPLCLLTNEIWTVEFHLLWTCFDKSIQNK